MAAIFQQTDELVIITKSLEWAGYLHAHFIV